MWIVYHGLTSLTQEPDLGDRQPQLAASGSDDLVDPVYAPFFQAMASSRHITVAPDIGNALLECFFCYSASSYCIVAKSTFLRDMALGGPLFSELLLMSIYAVATRMIDGLGDSERQAQGDLFIALAREMLSKELQGASKITTVQALLLMSGRESAVGNAIQGWTLAGIAFRLVQDLGIHLPWENVPGSASLSTEEKGVRDRLFWAAFTWDKGQAPSRIPDFDLDTQPWVPYFANPSLRPASLVGYTYQPRNVVAAFRQLASLDLIIHDLIVELYGPDSNLDGSCRVAFVARTRVRLEHYWAEFPGAMKGMVDPAPPPWVFSVRMLYHAAWILLYRPQLDDRDVQGVTGAGHICLTHSALAHELGSTYHRTFQGKMSYLPMYCAFVSATFDILLLKADDLRTRSDSLSRLKSWLEILSAVGISPGRCDGIVLTQRRMPPPAPA
ncbi:hypothetical protein JCM24511_03205 [Saitozyma sp. JCM 24511]|nr:hypothetical protein JCM24511_03205 [Saitozyma sp. JCM 24511]